MAIAHRIYLGKHFFFGNLPGSSFFGHFHCAYDLSYIHFLLSPFLSIVCFAFQLFGYMFFSSFISSIFFPRFSNFLIFFFLFLFLKEAQQETRPTSHWHSQVKHSGRGWLAGLSPATPHQLGLNFEPRIFFFLRSPDYRGLIPLSHLSSFLAFMFSIVF